MDSSSTTELVIRSLTAVNYLSILFFAGSVVFRSGVAVRYPTARVLGQMNTIALIIATLSGAALLPLSAIRVLGEPLTTLFDPGAWIIAVVPGLTLQVVAMSLLSWTAAAFQLARSRFARIMATILAMLSALTPVLHGHTRSTQPLWLMLGSDAVHLLAAAVWTGGLTGLALTLRAGYRTHRGSTGALLTASAFPASVVGNEAELSAEDGAQILRRFSAVALASMAALTLTGIAMAWTILDGPESLWGTPYGLTLLLKLSLATAVAMLAVWNRFALLPRTAGLGSGSVHWDRLRRFVAYEAAVLIVLVAVTGTLTNLSPHS